MRRLVLGTRLTFSSLCLCDSIRFWCFMAIRIGNGCGFWGDNLDAPVQLAETGRLDYLTLEYLAELTMSILALQKQRDPERRLRHATSSTCSNGSAPALRNQPKLKIVTNAGGMNPAGCAAKARDDPRRGRTAERGIAVVDRRRPAAAARRTARRRARLHQPRHRRTACRHSRAGRQRQRLPRRPADRRGLAARRRCRHHGPRRRRLADASARPCIRFGWNWDDWDRLAAGTVAGHLIECGARRPAACGATGTKSPDLANVGYPIAEIDDRRHFGASPSRPAPAGRSTSRRCRSNCCTKSATRPRYLTPDVVADFTIGAVDAGRPRRGARSPARRAGRRPTRTRCRSPTATASPQRARW